MERRARQIPPWLWRALFAIIPLTIVFAVWTVRTFPDFSFLEVWTTFNLGLIALGIICAPLLLGAQRLKGALMWLVPGAAMLIVLLTFAVFAVLDRYYGADPAQMFYSRFRWTLFGGISAAALYAGIITLWVGRRNKELANANKKLSVEKKESELSRQLSETKLRMLQAQIEPHFLFNSLAAAQQLSEKGAPNAAKLIGHLIRFLRLAIPSMRQESATVARECEFVGAYLAIMQTRMGKRLAYDIHITPQVAEINVPPAMLMTLVENAIKHGLEPSMEGGRIDVTAEREGEMIKLTVADTGVGLNTTAQKEAGSGLGLSNISERLQAIYAGRAQLELGANTPVGFKAVLRLPNTLPTIEANS